MNKQISGAIKSSDKEKYSHPIPDRDYILGLLNEHDTSLNRYQLAEAMQLYSEEEQEALRRRLRAMERDNQVIFHPRKGYRRTACRGAGHSAR